MYQLDQPCVKMTESKNHDPNPILSTSLFSTEPTKLYDCPTKVDTKSVHAHTTRSACIQRKYAVSRSVRNTVVVISEIHSVVWNGMRNIWNSYLDWDQHVKKLYSSTVVANT